MWRIGDGFAFGDVGDFYDGDAMYVACEWAACGGGFRIFEAVFEWGAGEWIDVLSW